MYHPTTRLLTILELLQTHPQMSGDELARRLEVEPRTVRRYILMLQEMGMPVEGNRGPGGGYRLRPGYKLPPLLFTEEEATAITLGLLGTQWLELRLPAPAVEGALAKVFRVLPLRGRERLQGLTAAMALSPNRHTARPDAALLVSLSDAVQERRRIRIEYGTRDHAVSERTVEPYGIAGWQGYWYLAAYCTMRQGLRLFRVDRIRQVTSVDEHFTRPENFDTTAFVVESLGTVRARWSVRVEFEADLQTVQAKIPAVYGEFTATARGTLFATLYDDLPTFVRFLMSLDLPFVVHEPEELRTAMISLAEKMIAMAHRQ